MKVLGGTPDEYYANVKWSDDIIEVCESQTNSTKEQCESGTTPKIDALVQPAKLTMVGFTGNAPAGTSPVTGGTSPPASFGKLAFILLALTFFGLLLA